MKYWYSKGYLKLASALAYLWSEQIQGNISPDQLSHVLVILRDCGILLRKEAYGTRNSRRNVSGKSGD